MQSVPYSCPCHMVIAAQAMTVCIVQLACHMGGLR